MDFPAMTIKEMLEWADDIRGVIATARKLAKELKMTPTQEATIEKAYAKEESRAAWLYQMVLAYLELEEEDADGQVP